MERKYRLPEVFVSREEIAITVDKLGERISVDYCGRSLTVLTICNGAMIFAADLVRAIDLPMELDSILIASYAGTSSTGTFSLRSELKTVLTGKDVLVVDDILDTGRTLSHLRDLLSGQCPASLKFCVLCDKRERREVDFEADYVGMVIPDRFVVGYGMDHDEFYRNLPYLGLINTENDHGH